MALPKNNFWLRPGRLEKKWTEKSGFEFTALKVNKDEIVWTYVCKFRMTPKVKCTARAKVALFENKWVLQHADCNHSCEPNRPRVIAELLKHKMKTLVRADPVQPVGKAIRKVRVEAAEKYGEEQDFYLHLIVAWQ